MNHKRNNKYYWYSPNSIITAFLISLALVVLSNMHGALAVANDSTSHEESVTDLLDKGNLAEFFDLGTGIFAAILFALSLLAYRRLKSKRILYVAIAFAIFAIRVIVSKLDLFLTNLLKIFK